MVDIEEIVDKANVKEFVAIVAGLVGSKLADNVLVNMEPKQRDLVKVGAGLVGTYFMNDMAAKNPRYGEFLALGGLALTAFAAKPVADRVSVEVSKKVGMPIVVKSETHLVKPTPEATTEVRPTIKL